MRVTKIRETIAKLFALFLVLALIIGVLIATGKHVPVISELLGR